MTNLSKCVLSLVAAAFLGVCFASAQGAPAGNAENGKKLYAANMCVMCHGMAGEGGSTGPRIAPDPIDLPLLIQQFRHPAGEMPTYDEKMISDAEAADIHAFLKTL